MENIINLDLLVTENVWGPLTLTILPSYRAQTKSTDFAYLSGASYRKCLGPNGEYGNFSLAYTKSPAPKGKVICIDFKGGKIVVNPEYERGVIRPIFRNDKVYNNLINYNMRFIDNEKTIDFGRYPQKVPESEMQIKLNRTFNKTLKETGNTFSYVLSDKVETLKEYTIDNRYFVRCKINSLNKSDVIFNNKSYGNSEYIWVEILPVQWLVDDETKTFICKYGLISNIKFSQNNYYDGKFENTFIKKFMDEYMAKDLFALEKKFVNKKINKLTYNTYNFDFENVSEEEIIKGAIESDVAVFLHGNSSEGKSARIKTLDKNAIMIYLCNATPDSLNGKSVYNSITNEMIDIKPTWLIKLESICEKEPDKNHILFFDELTNALPSIQGIAFNIILGKEVNGKWKLPDNARVVAAGNEMEESISANKLSKPLFNRFAHVYIKTTTPSWIKWASENNIHPAIISYIAYTNGSSLRSEYTGEKPNADPRKWEMASKILYKTGKPEMIRALVGNEITKEFCHFCKTKTITLNDIINGNITEEMLNMDIAEKYITVGSLTNIDIKYYEVVKCFIEKLGQEYLSLFNLLWSQNNEEKLEMVLEYEMEGKRKL